MCIFGDQRTDCTILNNGLPKDHHILTCRTNKHYLQQQQKDFADVIELKVLRFGDYYGLCGCALCVYHNCTQQREAEGDLTEKEEKVTMGPWRQKFEGCNHKSRNIGHLKTWNMQGADSVLENLEEGQPC